MRASIAAALVLVSGLVTYRNGAPAVNVMVVVGNQSGLTDVRGVYRIDRVAPGQQVVRVLKGNKTLAEKPVFVDRKQGSLRADIKVQ